MANFYDSLPEFFPRRFRLVFCQEKHARPGKQQQRKKLRENKKNIIELVRATQLETTFCS